MPKVVKSTKLVHPDFINFFNAHTSKFRIKALIGYGDFGGIIGYRIYLVEAVPFLWFSRENLVEIGTFDYVKNSNDVILELRDVYFDRYYQHLIAPICVQFEALRSLADRALTVTVVRYELVD